MSNLRILCLATRIRIVALGLLTVLNLPQTAIAAFFETLSIAQGLSQSSIFDIQQDKYGYLWIATNNGLNRYDGKQFITFNSVNENPDSPSALTGKTIYDITEDNEGNLWIATQNGLNYFNVDNYITKRFNVDNSISDSLSSQTIRKIAIGKNGDIWLATNQGLNHVNPKTHHIKYIKNNNQKNQKYPCSEDLKALAIDDNNHIWLGAAERGLCKYNPELDQYTAIDYQNNIKESASTGVLGLVQDGDSIWVGSVNGLFKYNTRTGKSVGYFHDPKNPNSLPSNWIQTLHKNSAGDLWIGTANGTAFFDTQNEVFTTYRKNKKDLNSISSNNIYSITIDKSGLVWIGSYDSGISIYNPNQAAFNYIGPYGNSAYSLSNSVVWNIKKAYDYVWIATNKGLNRYDPKTGKIKHYIPGHKNNLNPDTPIYAIAVGDQHDLWMATMQGMAYFDIKTETFKKFTHDINNPDSIPYNNTIASIMDRHGYIWLGFFGGGTAYYDPKSKKFTYFRYNANDPGSISSNIVYEILELSNGKIVFGTDIAINEYLPESQTFKKLTFTYQGKPFIDEEFFIFREAANGNLMIGTINSLNIANPALDTIIKTYSKKDGLDDDSIYAIEEDKQGNIWVSTNRGISRINPETDEIQNFDISDGLQGYEFNGKASHNDGEYLYFGGFNGLNFFRPHEVGNNTYLPPIVITAFKRNGIEIGKLDTLKPIHLSYQDTYLSIEFSALDYTSPKKNQYAYQMEGFDKDWIYSGNRSYASYTNLDAGQYTFKVKGANKYGNWNEEGALLKIFIESPPWKRWWAYSIYASVFTLIIFLITRSKILADSKALSDQIRRISTRLNQTMNLVAIQQQMADQMRLVFPYHQFMVYLKEGDHYVKGIEKISENQPQIEISENAQLNFLNHVADKKRPILLKTPHEFEIFNLSYITRSTLIGLPLLSQENIIGVIVILNPKSFFSLREDRLNIAITLSIQASAAIDNAHLFNKTRQLAFYDSLTGLENRQLFKERLELALKVVKRNGSELSVMFLDLDQFKRINDSLGHDQGDALLIEAAKRLKSCVRNNDTVARIGGDEFTILLPDINGIVGAQVVAKKILAAFQEPIDLQRHTINVSVSIGISIAPKDSLDANALMKNADAAMYKAKEKGRNNYQFFTEVMNIQASEQLNMENDIRRGLKAKEFILHYQPLIDIKTNSIIGVEALVRWLHPNKGIVPPMSFIPVAEETGLISALGEQILCQAFAYAKQLQQNNLSHIKIAVNLSVRQFIYGQLVETITQLLKEWNLDARWLELEITENVLIENTGETINILNELKRLGTTLAIDDFGTGYSSLSYLKQLPIDTLKVDRSFVRDIPYDIEDIEITAAIIAMAHKLNLSVIAEGVETPEQLEFLKLQNCDIAQGYYFYKPMPEENMLNLLKTNRNRKIINIS